MPVDLYVSHASSPCRGVLMACQCAGIETNMKEIDLMKKEQMSEAFLKINPTHTVPTIVDGDFNLWESRPIAIYLIDKYAPGHSLFPTDLQQRAMIERMLYFDICTVYKAIGPAYVYPIALEGKKDVEPTEMEAMLQRLNDDTFAKTKYAVGDDLTLADLFLVASVTLVEVVGYQIDEKRFPNLVGWINRIKGQEFYGAANAGYEKLKAFLAQMKADAAKE